MSILALSRPVTAVQSTFSCLCNSVSVDFRCIRVLNLAFIGCSRCALGFRFPEKYAHQNDPLNQGNLNELKLRLKIVKYPGIEAELFYGVSTWLKKIDSDSKLNYNYSIHCRANIEKS